jgi:hypothetical protein
MASTRRTIKKTVQNIPGRYVSDTRLPCRCPSAIGNRKILNSYFFFFLACFFITVRAATSLARLPYRPDFCADFLICSYWRCSFELAPRSFFLPGIN